MDFKKSIMGTVNWNVDDYGVLMIYIDRYIICTVQDCGTMSDSEIFDMVYSILEEFGYDTDAYLAR